ncbi:UNVERIFIED_CONTAM: hypothetical protein FKN15_051090 [Acipenser sinensis]
MTFYNDIYPFYPQQRTPFIFNLSQLIVILVFLVLACSFLVILPGIRGKGRLFWMFRIVLSLFIGVVTVVILYGGYMIVATGAFIIFSLISFATIHNVPYCTISLGTVSLETVFGGSFWLSLVTGILCLLIGGAVILMDVFIPQKLKILFTANEGDEDDDTHITECYLNESFLERDNVLPLGDVRVSVPVSIKT